MSSLSICALESFRKFLFSMDLVWLLIPLLLIVSFILMRKKNSKIAFAKWQKEEKNEGLPENTPEDAFVFVKYRGEVFSMRVWEKREYWDNYNRKERNEHLEGVKKALKRGDVIQEWLDEDVCCYLPKKGNLKKIRDDYKEFKRLGGVVKEE